MPSETVATTKEATDNATENAHQEIRKLITMQDAKEDGATSRRDPQVLEMNSPQQQLALRKKHTEKTTRFLRFN